MSHINDILLNTTYLIADCVCVGWVPLNKINNISCVHLLVSMETPSHPLALTSPRSPPLGRNPPTNIGRSPAGQSFRSTHDTATCPRADTTSSCHENGINRYWASLYLGIIIIMYSEIIAINSTPGQNNLFYIITLIWVSTFSKLGQEKFKYKMHFINFASVFEPKVIKSLSWAMIDIDFPAILEFLIAHLST